MSPVYRLTSKKSGRINGNMMPEDVAKKRKIEIGNFRIPGNYRLFQYKKQYWRWQQINRLREPERKRGRDDGIKRRGLNNNLLSLVSRFFGFRLLNSLLCRKLFNRHPRRPARCHQQQQPGQEEAHQTNIIVTLLLHGSLKSVRRNEGDKFRDSSARKQIGFFQAFLKKSTNFRRNT